MIGYVLLVSLAIVMGGVMYAWMQSYVPSEDIECPDGVSVLVTQTAYDCATDSLNLTIKNNGRFDIAGYFIKGSTDSQEDVATIDLVSLVSNTGDLYKFSNALILGNTSDENQFTIGEQTLNVFDLSEISEDLAFVELIPVRWQIHENKKRFVSCGEKSSFRQSLTC